MDIPSSVLPRLFKFINLYRLERYIKNVYKVPELNIDSDCLSFNLQPASHFRAFVPGLRNFTDESYREFWVRLVQGACKSGKKIKFFSNGDPADYAAAVEIVQVLKYKGLNVALESRPVRPEELIEHISNTTSLISTRMHAGIIAYGLGKNVIPISWDRKVDDVWNGVGLRQAVVPANVFFLEDPWPYFNVRTKYTKFDSAYLNSACDDVLIAIERCIDALGVNR